MVSFSEMFQPAISLERDRLFAGGLYLQRAFDALQGDRAVGLVLSISNESSAVLEWEDIKALLTRLDTLDVEYGYRSVGQRLMGALRYPHYGSWTGTEVFKRKRCKVRRVVKRPYAAVQITGGTNEANARTLNEAQLADLKEALQDKIERQTGSAQAWPFPNLETE